MTEYGPSAISLPTEPAHRPTATGHQHHAALATAIRARQEQITDALGELALRAPALVELAEQILAALRGGRKVLTAGNGGSAAEAQHFVAELVGRFRRERAPYAVIALTADSAVLTALANDYGYAEIFARQVRALGQPGDVLLLFSTSGESANLTRAVAEGKRRGVTTAAITGDGPNRLAGMVDLPVRVPATETATIQELHQIVTHLLCDLVEDTLAASEPDRPPTAAREAGDLPGAEG